MLSGLTPLLIISSSGSCNCQEETLRRFTSDSLFTYLKERARSDQKRLNNLLASANLSLFGTAEFNFQEEAAKLQIWSGDF